MSIAIAIAFVVIALLVVLAIGAVLNGGGSSHTRDVSDGSPMYQNGRRQGGY